MVEYNYIVGMSMGGGHGPQRNHLSSPLGIIHGLQSDPKHYKQISMKYISF